MYLSLLDPEYGIMPYGSDISNRVLRPIDLSLPTSRPVEVYQERPFGLLDPRGVVSQDIAATVFEPGYEYGAILPIKKEILYDVGGQPIMRDGDFVTGEIRPAIPAFIKDALYAAALPGASLKDRQALTPEELAGFSLSFTGASGVGGTAVGVPENALTAGGPRFTRNIARPKTEAGMQNLARISARNLKDPTVITDPIIGLPVTMQKTNPLKRRRYVEPNFLSGGRFINLPGDRTQAGVSLLGLGDNMRFDMPVVQRGGFDFMRETPGSVWASGDAVISGMANEVEKLRLLDPDSPVFALTQTMGGRAVDFSDQQAFLLLERVKLGERMGEIAPESIDKFDKAMRTGEGLQLKPKKKDSDAPRERYKFPDWPGLTDPNARDILAQNGQMRIQLSKLMEKQEYAKLGFPDVAQTRAMITDPNLIEINPDMPMFGYNIGKIDMENPIRDVVDMPHPAYPTQLAGDYVGSLREQLPLPAAFPEFYRTRRLEGKDIARDRKSSEVRVLSQEANAEFFDSVGRYLDALETLGKDETILKYISGELF